MAIGAYPCLPALISALGRCPVPNARIRTMVLQVLESMNGYSSAKASTVPLSSFLGDCQGRIW